MADTFSGLLMAFSGKVLTQGDRIDLPGAAAEIMEVENNRAKLIRLTLTDADQQAPVEPGIGSSPWEPGRKRPIHSSG